MQMNSIESASGSLHKGLGYAKKLSAKRLEYLFYKQLSIFYEIKGKPGQSLNYFKKFKGVKQPFASYMRIYSEHILPMTFIKNISLYFRSLFSRKHDPMLSIDEEYEKWLGI